MTPTLVTVAVFLAFLWTRRTFDRLSLHYDTGFYVSPHTVMTGRVCYAKGWNARYAGCCKVLPEFFFARAYLTARRRSRQSCPTEAGRAYARLFRFRLSLYQFVTAMIVGVLAYQWFGNDLAFYYAGLVSFCLLVSEAQYGNYHECAESFELLPQAAAVLLLAMGLSASNPLCIAAAAFVWSLDAFFIKLSSLVSWVVLFGIATALHHAAILPILLGIVTAGLLYLLWRRACGAELVASWRALVGHEKSFNRRNRRLGLVHRVREKLSCLGRVVVRQPVIPLLAAVGVFQPEAHSWLLIAYLLGTASALVVQATDCRYYLIPMLPPLALLGACGVVSLWTAGWLGAGLVLALLLTWLFLNVVHPRRMGDQPLNRWCWRNFRPEAEIARNETLERAAPNISSVVAGRSMLVFGPLTQAYVLTGAGYETQLISPDHHLDDMDPGWQAELNRRLVGDPPAFVLDTNRCFAAHVARSRLGLDYRLVLDAGTDLLLYELKHRLEAKPDYESAQTFMPVSRRQQDYERQMGFAPETTPILDEVESQLAALLNTVHENGHRRLAVYGAGRFTIRHADVYRASRVPVCLVLDDNADLVGERFLDWPLRKPGEAMASEFDAVIVSTDRFAEPMLRRVREQWQGRIPAYTLK